MPTILGLSAYHHDSAACLVWDGEVLGSFVLDMTRQPALCEGVDWRRSEYQLD